MTNRIGTYYGDVRDIKRAEQTLNFCHSMSRVCHGADCMEEWELDALGTLQLEAIAVFRGLGVALPWEQPARR
ncbi:MAG TPA: hypothetical protein VGG64_28915 [Pirellulales bacterium]|jgi:hypothetical protein